LLLHQEQTVNKGPSTSNPITNQIQESITTTGKESIRTKHTDTNNRITNKKTNKTKNNNIIVQTIRLRRGGEGITEDMYFESSDEEEEEEEHKNEMRKRTETASTIRTGGEEIYDEDLFFLIK
jgi:hypothetical protein